MKYYFDDLHSIILNTLTEASYMLFRIWWTSKNV